jgi:hypothetical protein
LKGKLSIVDLLEPTSPDQLLFRLKISITFLTKQATLTRSTILSLALQLVFPALRVSPVLTEEGVRQGILKGEVSLFH